MLRDASSLLSVSQAPYKDFTMPSEERNRYWNKETAKVNAGLDFGGSREDGKEARQTIGAWCSNNPVVNIDFSSFHVPSAAPGTKPSTEELVQRLLNPPAHAFVHGVLSIQWVITVAGTENFCFRASDERFVLSQTSALRREGHALGMRTAYLEWLCGDDLGSSAAEQGMFLTPAFFTKEM
ncbi:hypothetical protein BU26DRAFT_438139 [Trematosphaeria pertusa]|uniref:Uncharacterized protein n=1 Tax=Trematosphaeria pertusa TaxID=390896 RepID=A0A6A6HWR3_9PLEO|nr:uncharacterized protein BU26DRAFT_438139 [Trematosphaeria pertusa]KAF2242645.1 hypothetical protein BU26DRAFT_438139 [Trematosphaeria pertusa]